MTNTFSWQAFQGNPFDDLKAAGWNVAYLADTGYARDWTDEQGHTVLDAHSIMEVQADGSQKEIWYVS